MSVTITDSDATLELAVKKCRPIFFLVMKQIQLENCAHFEAKTRIINRLRNVDLEA